MAWSLSSVAASQLVLVQERGTCYNDRTEQSCHCKGVGLPSYIRWEVVRMKFDFKDLMAFGTFILALLTFIVYNCK